MGLTQSRPRRSIAKRLGRLRPRRGHRPCGCICQDCREFGVPEPNLVLELLPQEVLENVLGYLSLADLGNVHATSKVLSELPWRCIDIEWQPHRETQEAMRFFMSKNPKDIRMAWSKGLNDAVPILIGRRLQRLNLSEPREPLTDVSFEHLCRGLLDLHGTLVELCLSRNSISNHALYILCNSLRSNSSLRVLDLQFCNLGDKAPSYIACALLRNRYLTSLNLGGVGFQVPALHKLCSGLVANSTLKSLNISDNDLGPAGAQLLASVINRCQLEKLDISDNRIKNQGMRLIGNALATNSRLIMLVLDSNRIQAEGLQPLCKALSSKSTALEYLSLWDNPIGNSGAKMLGQCLAKNTSMVTLNLNFSDIGDVGDLAKGLRINTTLTKLTLRHCPIRNPGAMALAVVLKTNHTLQHLDLEFCDITAPGSAALGEALVGNETLRTLDLKGNAIGDIGAECLARGLTRNKSLVHLDLRADRRSKETIGIIGAVCLAKTLKINRTLKVLKLEGNSVGQEYGHLFAESLCNVRLLLNRVVGNRTQSSV